MNIEDELVEILNTSDTLPFLFIGSGISQRYLKTESWEELLKKFAPKEINYYKSLTESSYPKMGSKIAEDFFPIWWESAEYEGSRNYITTNEIELSTQSEPFKFEVSKHLDKKLDIDSLSSELQEELEAFKQIQISGVITTNYDTLIEELFENRFKRYVGQEEMLFNRSYEVGELFKIHGCCSDFKSIVITEDDYKHFEETNLFLTSKLLSFFIEYPIIFMGYSFNDKNVHNILENILKSVGQKNVEKLHNRLIFIEWHDLDSASCNETIKTIQGINLPITHIKTKSFLPIYKALSQLHAHLPVHLIRQIKDSLYNIITTDEPTKRILVREEDFDKLDDLEVVLGVGVINEVSTKGYNCLEAYDLFENLLKTEPIHYSPTKMLEDVLPKRLRVGTYLPVYQYLSEANITQDNYSDFGLEAKVVNIIEFEKNAFSNRGNLEFLGADKEVVESYLQMFQEDRCGDINLETLRSILMKNLNVIIGSQSHAVHQTDFKKLCCLYDKLKYGW